MYLQFYKDNYEERETHEKAVSIENVILYHTDVDFMFCCSLKQSDIAICCN